VGDLLPSMILGGTGVGLALSSLIAAGATALSPDRSAPASGTVNSVRQIASALGVAVLITLLGSGGSIVGRYERGWSVAAALSLVAAVVGLGLGVTASLRQGHLDAAREERVV
jgi:hypothetical protein